MTTQLNPYLNFQASGREAMEFYESVFGGELTISTFADLGAEVDESEKNLVMHSVLTTPDGLVLMGADTAGHVEYRPAGNVSVSLSGTDDAELRGYWAKLSDGATNIFPLNTAPWGDSFGMCTDKFGINWLVNITAS